MSDEVELDSDNTLVVLEEDCSVLLEVATGVGKTFEELELSDEVEVDSVDEVVALELEISVLEVTVVLDDNSTVLLVVDERRFGRIPDELGTPDVVKLDSSNEVVVVELDSSVLEEYVLLEDDVSVLEVLVMLDDEVSVLEVVVEIEKTSDDEGVTIEVVELLVNEFDILVRLGNCVVVDGLVVSEVVRELVTVVRVVMEEVDRVEDVVVVDCTVEELVTGPSSSQGSTDSRFLATYRFNLERPPQN